VDRGSPSDGEPSREAGLRRRGTRPRWLEVHAGGVRRPPERLERSATVEHRVGDLGAGPGEPRQISAIRRRSGPQRLTERRTRSASRGESERLGTSPPLHATPSIARGAGGPLDLHRGARDGSSSTWKGCRPDPRLATSPQADRIPGSGRARRRQQRQSRCTISRSGRDRPGSHTLSDQALASATSVARPMSERRAGTPPQASGWRSRSVAELAHDLELTFEIRCPPALRARSTAAPASESIAARARCELAHPRDATPRAGRRRSSSGHDACSSTSSSAALASRRRRRASGGVLVAGRPLSSASRRPAAPLTSNSGPGRGVRGLPPSRAAAAW